MWQTVKQWLSASANIAPLATFRVVFGAMCLFSTARFMYLGWIDDHYLAPQWHFKYFGFEWVQVAPAWLLYGLHIVLLLAALGLLLGLFYRLSAVLFCLIFTYTELIDVTYYLNHYYFVSLTALLCCFLPLNRSFSLDVYRGAVGAWPTAPRYALFLLRFQIFIVYFYAGLAKINPTWLFEALPLKIWLPANDTLPVLGSWLKQPFMAYAFSWAGMLFDTFIIFFLAYKPTRLWAYAAIVVFHTLTGLMFQIGIFPLVMMGATLLFFSDKWHLNFQKNIENVLKWLKITTFWPKKSLKEGDTEGGASRRSSHTVAAVVLFYVAFQLLFPWRFLAYKDNLFWTEQGYRFGWRVMLMEKAGTATFYVKDRRTGREGVVLNDQFLNPHQEKQMAMQPDLILQYAHLLQKYYEKKGVYQPIVRAEVYITLNGQPSRLYFDPYLDLTTIKDSWADKTWLYPYHYK